MSWITLYAVTALIVAVAAFLLAEWIREPGTPAPDHPGAIALVAGALFPVVIVGALQWAIIAAAHARMRNTVSPQAPRTPVKSAV